MANKLDAEISTFGELVSRECQDKLTIEQYFGDKNLKRFIPILAKEDFRNVSSLTCEDEEEYNEILRLIENKGSDDEKEEIDGKLLMTEWGLAKFWDAMEEMG